MRTCPAFCMVSFDQRFPLESEEIGARVGGGAGGVGVEGGHNRRSLERSRAYVTVQLLKESCLCFFFVQDGLCSGL